MGTRGQAPETARTTCDAGPGERICCSRTGTARYDRAQGGQNTSRQPELSSSALTRPTSPTASRHSACASKATIGRGKASSGRPKDVLRRRGSKFDRFPVHKGMKPQQDREGSLLPSAPIERERDDGRTQPVGAGPHRVPWCEAPPPAPVAPRRAPNRSTGGQYRCQRPFRGPGPAPPRPGRLINGWGFAGSRGATGGFEIDPLTRTIKRALAAPQIEPPTTRTGGHRTRDLAIENYRRSVDRVDDLHGLPIVQLGRPGALPLGRSTADNLHRRTLSRGFPLWPRASLGRPLGHSVTRSPSVGPLRLGAPTGLGRHFPTTSEGAPFVGSSPSGLGIPQPRQGRHTNKE